MSATSNIERDVDRVRFEIYTETKDLTHEQRVERARMVTDPFIQKYGLTVIARAEDDPRLKSF